MPANRLEVFAFSWQEHDESILNNIGEEWSLANRAKNATQLLVVIESYVQVCAHSKTLRVFTSGQHRFKFTDKNQRLKNNLHTHVAHSHKNGNPRGLSKAKKNTQATYYVARRSSYNYCLSKSTLRSDIFLVKLVRAAGGCLGINRRRRTRIPAKSSGELEKSIDPEESEWGNPLGVKSHHP